VRKVSSRLASPSFDDASAAKKAAVPSSAAVAAVAAHAVTL
jgi:hypothetical protein